MVMLFKLFYPYRVFDSLAISTDPFKSKVSLLFHSTDLEKLYSPLLWVSSKKLISLDEERLFSQANKSSVILYKYDSQPLLSNQMLSCQVLRSQPMPTKSNVSIRFDKVLQSLHPVQLGIDNQPYFPSGYIR